MGDESPLKNVGYNICRCNQTPLHISIPSHHCVPCRCSRLRASLSFPGTFVVALRCLVHMRLDRFLLDYAIRMYGVDSIQVGLLPAKNTKYVVTAWVLSSSECTKTSFRPGLCPGPYWGSLRRSPKPRSRLGKGTAPPHSPPPRRLRRLDLAAILPCYKRNIRQS